MTHKFITTAQNGLIIAHIIFIHMVWAHGDTQSLFKGWVP